MNRKTSTSKREKHVGHVCYSIIMHMYVIQITNASQRPAENRIKMRDANTRLIVLVNCLDENSRILSKSQKWYIVIKSTLSLCKSAYSFCKQDFMRFTDIV